MWYSALISFSQVRQARYALENSSYPLLPGLPRQGFHLISSLVILITRGLIRGTCLFIAGLNRRLIG